MAGRAPSSGNGGRAPSPLDRPAPALPRSVLFICNLNAVRSPMAHALADHHCRRRVYVDSVGVAAGELDPFSVAAMAELGLDISHHRPKSFDALPVADFDLIISLTPEAQHRAVEMTRHSDAELEYWPTLDPTLTDGSREQRLDAYRQVRDGLKQRITDRFDFPAPGHL